SNLKTMQKITNIEPLLDPELAQALASLPFPPPGGLEIASRRSLARQFSAAYRDAAPALADLRIEDVEIPSSGSRPAVSIRIIAPLAGRSDVVLLWMHGGGFSSGHHQDEDIVTAPWVRATGCTVVSVGYRLAPEHPHPAASDDCYAVLEWLASSTAPLGFVPARIAIGGISAGAALAAATALRARDAGGPSICFQLLLVPCTDNRSVTASMMTLNDTRQWHREANIKAWNIYAGGDGEVSPYAAPARATDLGGLPPAYIEIAGADPLRDEGIEYGLRMMQAGVSVELHVFPGALHASTYLQPLAGISVRAREETLAALRRVIGMNVD
ncbi:MAG: alpha/beta hydrolase, partial [Pseudomonadota bacterium]|nr:alpha/beta hydrolase [Pseudomonadota bacterium]